MSELKRRGFAMREVIAVVVIVVVIIVFAVLLSNLQPGGCIAPVRDSTQLSQIHKGMLMLSRQLDGRLPTPGLINRLPHPVEGNVPGVGPEDVSQNTTANLFSSMIAQDYMTAPVVVCPTEPSDKVIIKTDYNHNAYSPINDVYWDPTFKADLHTESNTSYAHLPIHGKRSRMMWNDNVNSSWAILSDRGPKDGEDTSSITLKTHGPNDEWWGNVVFADNSVVLLESVFLPQPPVIGQRDNIFAESGAMDVILSFTKSMSEDGYELDWD